MKIASFEAIIRALQNANVDYLVAGGLAVNAHGYLRFTADVDLVLALNAHNINHAFEALAELGYKPGVPITAEQFSDPEKRQSWIAEKGMKVLSFYSDQHRETTVDIFVYEPFDFKQESKIALKDEMLPGLAVQFVSIPTLISMKKIANRARDNDDIKHLQLILEDRTPDETNRY